MTSRAMRVGFVFTNYNNSGFTRAAVASLHESGQWADVRVAIVDNRSWPDDVAALERIAADYPGVELLLSPVNVGYFPGLNVGIRHLRAKCPELQHIVVGNNDLTFPKDFVAALQRFRDVFASWAVVSPDIVTPDGGHQNPHVLYPVGRVRRLIWDAYFSSALLAPMIRAGAWLTRSITARRENNGNGDLHKTSGPIEQGYGACYILGPLFFKHFKQLCAPTFLMHEEFFLYEQLKYIGQMTYYDPRFVVYHFGHATTRQLPRGRHHQIASEAHRVFKRYIRMSRAEQQRFLSAETRRLG